MPDEAAFMPEFTVPEFTVPEGAGLEGTGPEGPVRWAVGASLRDSP